MGEPAGAATILICVATSPRAAAVANEGVAVAGLLGAQFRFVNVGSDTPQQRQRLREALAGAAGEITLADDQLLIRSGRAAESIIAAARETSATMIIMGALDRDPPATRIWGSVARRVARQAPCSVMLLPEPSLQKQRARQIVVSIKLDEESVRMVHLVLAMARRGEASVHFVYEFSIAEARWIPQLAQRRVTSPVTTDEYIAQRQRAERLQLDEFLSGFDLKDLATSRKALAGEEGAEVLEYARANSADLLVMPAPRRLGFFARLSHHPVEVMLERLPCALLLYRWQPPPGKGRGE